MERHREDQLSLPTHIDHDVWIRRIHEHRSSISEEREPSEWCAFHADVFAQITAGFADPRGTDSLAKQAISYRDREDILA